MGKERKGKQTEAFSHQLEILDYMNLEVEKKVKLTLLPNKRGCFVYNNFLNRRMSQLFELSFSYIIRQRDGLRFL